MSETSMPDTSSSAPSDLAARSSNAASPDTESSTEKSSTEKSSTAMTALKVLAALAVVAVLVLLGREAGGYVQQFAKWVESLGVWGPIAFMAGYAVAAVAFVPGSLLTLAAGAIFGLGKGTVYVLIGASLGAALAFLVSRYIARGWIEKKLKGNERFAAIDRAVGKQGLKIVTLMRLSPIFPFNLLNYALGLTKVRFIDYLIASLGMLPGTFLYVFYGKAAGDVAALAAGGAQQEKGVGDWIVLGLGLLATIVVTAIVTRIARRALQEEADV